MNGLQSSFRLSGRVAMVPTRSPIQSLCAASFQPQRQFSANSLRRSAAQGAVFAQGETAHELQRALQNLVPPSGRWALTQDGMGIERFFQFKSFKSAWTFMNDVAGQCRTHKHHPEWSNVYNKVFVRWTTHNPRGISNGDLTLADLCDKFANRDESKEIGSSSAGKKEELTGLADRAADKTGGAPDTRELSEAQKQEEKAKVEKEEGEESKQGSLAGIGGQPS